jgi:hypothetical protein
MKHPVIINRTSRLGAVAAMLLLASCGPEADTETAHPQPLRCIDNYGYPSDDPVCPFATDWVEYSPSAGGADISHTKDPALCFGPGAQSVLAISADSSMRYRTLTVNGDAFATSWGSYGTKQFFSRPACAMRESVSGKPGFVIAGQAIDGQIWASAGHMNNNLANGTPVNPTADQAFSVVDSSGNNPTIASCISSDQNCGTGEAVAFFFSGDDSTIIARRRPFPYTTNNWSARINGPALPNGATADGPAAVVYVPVWTAFHIVVLGSDGLLYETFFSAFSNTFFANPVPGWSQLTITGPINGDPSLSYSAVLGYETLVFRSGNNVMQTSGLVQIVRFGDLPVLQIGNIVGLLNGMTGPLPFVGGPASWGQAPIDTLSAATLLSRVDTCAPNLCMKLVVVESHGLDGQLGP